MNYDERRHYHNREERGRGDGRSRGGRNPWRRRMARVPKGHLRHYALKLLNETPMSGSEIMSSISARTEEKWQPSPGSVYPLLAWLQDSAYIVEAAEQEAGIKRYALTDAGKEFLKEHDEHNPDFDERITDFGPRFRGSKEAPEDVRELYKGIRKIRMRSKRLFDRIREDYSEDLVKDAKAAVDDFLSKLEQLAEKEEV
ncbi:MAG: PadR family transcriptional regulator [Candidatus Thorarchaeota archaeon]